MLKSHINQHFLSVEIIMLTNFKRKIKSLTHILWLTLLVLIIIFVTNFQQTNKNLQYESIKKNT